MPRLGSARLGSARLGSRLEAYLSYDEHGLGAENAHGLPLPLSFFTAGGGGGGGEAGDDFDFGDDGGGGCLEVSLVDVCSC